MGIYGCRPSGGTASPDATSQTPIDVPTLGSAAESEPAAQEDEVPIGSPTPDTPIVVAAAVFPQQARPGDTVTLVVRVRMGIGWHISAIGQKTPSATYTPTTFDLMLPSGIKSVGEWLVPQPERFRGRAGQGLVYQGEIVVRRKLQVASHHTRWASLNCRAPLATRLATPNCACVQRRSSSGRSSRLSRPVTSERHVARCRQRGTIGYACLRPR